MGRWDEAKTIEDKSKTIGIGHEVLDGSNSHTYGPKINTGVAGIPFLSNNIAKMKHTKKGEPKTMKNSNKFLPLFAKGPFAIGDEFFYRYGAGYGGYQNSEKELFDHKDIISREDQFYFRECNVNRFREQFERLNT